MQCVLERVEQFTKFQLGVSQKDAYLRAFQFASRALIHLLRDSSKYAGVRTKFVSSMNTVSMGRSVFMLGNPITEWVNFKNVLLNGEPLQWLKVIQLIKCIAMAKFFLCDNINLLTRHCGLFKINNGTVGLAGSRFLFLAVLCNVILDSKLLADYQPPASSTEPENPETAEKRKVVRVRMLHNICDVFVVGSGSKLFPLNEAVAGSLGCLSALLVAWELWPAAQKPKELKDQ
eukprot:TRINITY_DN7124_c0_g1_i1.p2 TRINITY_DN7124_c0_g1~~TRINITY_DN7124_c0_g1_i1.p2  ORF type:complete len:244 (+),score=82.06 TRINITY_DN7124_c0_g1_i1:37-732(+)